MISQVYFAQKKKSLECDWYNLVKNDLKEMKLDQYSEDDIGKMKKRRWKNIVKKAIKFAAFTELKREADTKSKLEHLNYEELKMQKYLKSKDISKSKKLLLFKLRTKMIHVNHNYGVKSICKICNQGPDDQEHLTKCLFLKLKTPEILNLKENEHMQIFGENCTKMSYLSEIFEHILRQREILLDKQRAK